MDTLKKNHKDTAACVQASSTFLQSLVDIERVVILGHSLALIDKPYFDYVNKIVGSNGQWWASYYPSSEEEAIRSRLEEIVDDENRMKLIEMSLLTK